MQVVRMESERALCVNADEHIWVDMSLIGNQTRGTWVLVFLGVAREVLDPLRAEQVKDALCAVEAVMKGQSAGFDELFADLTDREPQLPPHLQNK